MIAPNPHSRLLLVAAVLLLVVVEEAGVRPVREDVPVPEEEEAAATPSRFASGLGLVTWRSRATWRQNWRDGQWKARSK